jgi:hypothetical protein
VNLAALRHYLSYPTTRLSASLAEGLVTADSGIHLLPDHLV